MQALKKLVKHTYKRFIFNVYINCFSQTIQSQSFIHFYSLWDDVYMLNAKKKKMFSIFTS